MKTLLKMSLPLLVMTACNTQPKLNYPDTAREDVTDTYFVPKLPNPIAGSKTIPQQPPANG